jgi:hypothetical protein
MFLIIKSSFILTIYEIFSPKSIIRRIFRERSPELPEQRIQHATIGINADKEIMFPMEVF